MAAYRRTPMTHVEIDRNRELPAPLSARDESELCALLARLERSWNDGNGDAYAAAFTEDSDYVAFDGTRLRGRVANAGHHAQLFASVLRGSRLVFEPEATTFRHIGGGAVVMHTCGSVLLPWQRLVARSRRSIQTLVLVRERDQWRVASFHNTRIRPMPSSGPMVWLFSRFVAAYLALTQRLPAPPAPKATV